MKSNTYFLIEIYYEIRFLLEIANVSLLFLAIFLAQFMVSDLRAYKIIYN